VERTRHSAGLADLTHRISQFDLSRGGILVSRRLQIRRERLHAILCERHTAECREAMTVTPRMPSRTQDHQGWGKIIAVAARDKTKLMLALRQLNRQEFVRVRQAEFPWLSCVTWWSICLQKVRRSLQCSRSGENGALVTSGRTRVRSSVRNRSGLVNAAKCPASLMSARPLLGALTSA
jgi:hypothetical protein